MIKKISLIKALPATDIKERFHVYRKLWEQAGRYEILTDFPLHLDIELSGLCNLKCKKCFQNHINSKLGLMPTTLYKKIIDHGAKNGLCAVKLQVRGESLLHPDIIDCIEYAKKNSILDVQITTNATLLTSQMSQSIIRSGLDGIIFSFDSHHGDSIETKGLSKYNAVERNIHSFLKLRKKIGSLKPWVRIASSIPAKDTGQFETRRSAMAKKFPDADIIAVNRMHEVQNHMDSYPDLSDTYQLRPCSHLLQRLSIFWDGSVTTCCMDYNNKFALGSVNQFHQDIKKIWLSDKMRSLRDAHMKMRRKTIQICRHCHVDAYGGHHTSAI